jgi:DNA-directed RNA polymerase specialized sigma24 family protein
MRWRLIDEGRKPHPDHVPADDLSSPLRGRSANLNLAIDIDRLRDELAATHPDWCMVVEVKCYLGFTDQEAADVLGMPLRTLQRMWRDARRWLFERTQSGNAGKGKGHGAGR